MRREDAFRYSAFFACVALGLTFEPFRAFFACLSGICIGALVWPRSPVPQESKP